ELGFEVQAGRQSEIGVGRPGEAVDAAVLAATIRVDRAIEGNVGRIVARDDLPRGIDGHRRLERRQLLEALPAVVESNARERLIAARGVRLRATSAAASALNRHVGVGRRLKADSSRTRRLPSRASPETARRRGGGWPGGVRRRRAFYGCVGTSHGSILRLANKART